MSAELGGLDADFPSIVAACYELAQCCSSTAMVFAMHQIQVACLMRHAHGSPWHQAFITRLAREQLLLASATTEGGSGGDIRRSDGALQTVEGRASLEKTGCVISYAEQADAILVTARRSSCSTPSDQVAILADREQCRLRQTSQWDALGMRGTCSQGYDLALLAETVQIMPTPYADIAAQTMLPVAHITWSAVWLGIATAACTRARNVVRRRTIAGSPHPAGGALRLSEALVQLQGLRAQVTEAARRYQAAQDDADLLSSISFALGMNQLKLAVSMGAAEVVGQALLVAGLAGYRNNSSESIGRHLRDVHSAALMISNDRIIGNCAFLLGAYRGEESLFQ